MPHRLFHMVREENQDPAPGPASLFHFLAGSFREHFHPVAVEFFGIAWGRLAMMAGNDPSKVASHSSMVLIFGLKTTYLSMSVSFLREISTYTTAAGCCLHPTSASADATTRPPASVFIDLPVSDGMNASTMISRARSGFLRSIQRPAQIL